MSKRALNAVRKPQPKTEATQISLTESQKMAVELVVGKENLLQQQQQQFMANQAAAVKQKSALISEIEKANRLPAGAILRGEWAIIDGTLVKQSKE